MSEQVVVLGAGYAGTGAIRRLERTLTGAQLTWIDRHDHHLVLHESHRIVRDPSAASKITVPVEAIKRPATTFLQGEVQSVDTAARTVHLADGATVDYDYLVVALGSRTAFYGVPGLREHAHTLKGLDDARTIHDDVKAAGRGASRDEPANVVIGGAGLSGVQVAGEVAALRDHHRLPLEIHLVEAMETIMPGAAASLRAAVRARLRERDVQIHTDDPITEATDDVIHFDVGGDPLPHDVLVWTGGVTGQSALDGAGLDHDHNRLLADATFATSDDRVFAVGDAAVIDQNGSPAPPTAQAAWQAADVVAANVARRIEGRPLRTWTYRDRGTLVSIGEDALASGVDISPVETFGGLPARFLKKFVAARWIADVAGWGRALDAWSVL